MPENTPGQAARKKAKATKAQPKSGAELIQEELEKQGLTGQAAAAEIGKLAGSIGTGAEKEQMPKLIKTTLKERGAKLPIGVVQDGALRRDFEVLSEDDWTPPVERKIGAIRKDAENMTVGQFVSKILCLTLKRVGKVEFTDRMPQEQKMMLLSEMFQQDVMYMYIWLRYIHIGRYVKMNVECGRCSHEPFDFPADLDTLDVEVYPDGVGTLEQLIAVSELKNGMEIGSQRFRYVRIKPVQWKVMEQMTRATTQDDWATSEMMFLNSVVGFVGLDRLMVCTQSMLDTMKGKADIEKLKHDVDSISAGADMVVSGKCPGCNLRFTRLIQWGYESFFSNSSVPNR